MWFDLELVWDIFGKIANLLPFVNAVEPERAMINGEFIGAISNIYPVVIYAIVIVTGDI